MACVFRLQSPLLGVNLRPGHGNVPKSNLASNSQLTREENANQSEVPLHSSQRQEIDLNSLEFDPAKRTPILNYHPNDRDVIRRAYLRQGFKSWNKKKSFKQHIRANSTHNQAKKKNADLMRQQQSIISAFERQSDQVKHEYWLRQMPQLM
ncbi:hypothetical protein H5410_042325 [Solanum commersonii]|uniref:DUF4371 domain-containing protein n=1 Tax=Solanum commersonii TaxID=4109 RepID=A0A9J5XU12_SOLCO|nr:hypothetical protein H5410_042325 [Solanum commersonii]